jgi:S1-C subfamily serine protease
MSQTYDPNDSEHSSGPEGGQGYPSGQAYPSGQGYPSGQAYPGGQGYGAGPGSGAGGYGPGGYGPGGYGAGGYGAGGYGTGAGYGGGQGGGPGFGSEPPPPRRRSHKRGLAITAAIALVAGAAVGGIIGSTDTTSTGTATATSKTVLSTSQIAARVDPGLVDVVSTDGDEQATSAGTGIVLTSNGEVLTNNHVIEGATAIKVTDIGNGKTYTAQVVGYDASQDVAVIQLENASGLTIASLGNSSSVQTGDSVVALGNAGGKGGTPSVATGTVTALNQSITASDELSGASEQLTGLVEDNADIQPGDSGGSLVNSYGQVIGMDTAASTGYSLQSPSGQSSTGTEQAYAIPIDEALSIAKQIEAGTTSTDVHIGATGFLGVEIGSASEGSGSGSTGGFGGGQSSTSGVTIAGTLSGSPAANAGLGEGDEITALGGQSVSNAEDISQALIKYHPGDSISVTWVDQTGQSHTSTLTLASGPAA